MLILTRKPNESITIGDSVVVKVLSIQGGKVRLGIEANPNIRIVRGEINGKPPIGNPEIGHQDVHYN